MGFFHTQKGAAFFVNAGKQVLLHQQLVMLPLSAEDVFTLPIFCVKRRMGSSKEADMFVKHVVDNFSK